MKVLVVEPNRVPYMAEIKNSLDEMQKIVGGLIQAVYPFDSPVALICNDEGKAFRSAIKPCAPNA